MTEQINIIRVEHSKENPYFMMNRDTAQDDSLTWEARGVLSYLLSKPDDWKVMVVDLQQKCGRDKVRHILDELKAAKYLKIIPARNTKGKFSKAEYQVFEQPFTENPTTDIPFTGLPTTGNPATEKPETVKRPLQSIDTQKTEKQKTDNKESNAHEKPLEVVTSQKPTPSIQKPKWFDEDCLIDVWAGVRRLDAVSIGADYHTKSDREKAKTMLEWPKPVTPDEICEVMKNTKHPAYPFAFIPKDVIELRAKKAMSAPPAAKPDPDMPQPAHPVWYPGMSKTEKSA